MFYMDIAVLRTKFFSSKTWQWVIRTDGCDNMIDAVHIETFQTTEKLVSNVYIMVSFSIVKLFSVWINIIQLKINSYF